MIGSQATDESWAVKASNASRVWTGAVDTALASTLQVFQNILWISKLL